MDARLEALRGGLIVSCQAAGENPLTGADMMAKMAKAAQMGGAVGIRANGPDDVRAIRAAVDLPVIGLYKQDHDGFDVYITPTWDSAKEIIDAGAEIIAVDATARPRPGGETLADLIEKIHGAGRLVMADISTLEEGVQAAELGADFVGTTLSGYTPYSPQQEGPDFELVEALAAQVTVPVIAEGRYWTPEDVNKALELGAFAVVVGTAITNPWKITERFVSKLIREGR